VKVAEKLMIVEYLKVSICIPAYENHEILKRSLTSIKDQSYTNWEVIITDDSKTNQVEIVAKQFDDDRIKYIKNNSSLGSPSNWNYSISLATGDLIKIIHNDDWFAHRDSLQEFVYVFTNNPTITFAFSQCNRKYESRRTKVYKADNFLVKRATKNPELLCYINIIGPPSAVIYKRNENTITFDSNTRWYVDAIFYIKSLKNNASLNYIQKPLMNITNGGNDQLTYKIKDEEKFKEAIYMFRRYTCFSSKCKTLIFKIHFIELMSRYNIKSLQPYNLLAEEVEAVEPLLKISRIGIPYKVFSLIKLLMLRGGCNI
jgi:glycosyltransferase involved in cell wall biosynthesis